MRGSIVHRGKAYYIVLEEPTQDGKRKQRWISGFRTRREAEAERAKLVANANEGTYVAPSKATLSEYLNGWLDGQKDDLRPSTLASYRMNVETHICPAIGNVRLQRLTKLDLDRLYADLLSGKRRRALSPRTVRYIHTIIRKALADAAKGGDVPRNVAAIADPPKQRHGVRMRTWSAEELRTFLDAAREDRLHGAFVLAASTGMRRGEVLGLRWREVDLDAGRLSVLRTVVVVGNQPHFSEPKTDKSRRSVPLPPQAVGALRDHRKRQLQERLAWGPDYMDADLVFCREDGSPLHPDRLADTFKRYTKAAGLPLIRAHDLRHTFATLALQAGVPAKVVSEILGHANIGITLDLYTHVDPGMSEDATSKVAALIFR